MVDSLLRLMEFECHLDTMDIRRQALPCSCQRQKSFEQSATHAFPRRRVHGREVTHGAGCPEIGRQLKTNCGRK